ncbi:MAG: flagellar biosynthesis protein FlaG [Massilia sp.]|nr:flagellar biosynthesis protein FlaG [Massilia sp.]
MDLKINGNASPLQAYLERPASADASAPAQPPAAPPAQADVVQPAPPADPAQVTKAVKNINQAMQDQGLVFSVDDSNRTIVKVVDRQTGEVIRQMPSKEALEIAQALERAQGLLISQKA